VGTNRTTFQAPRKSLAVPFACPSFPPPFSFFLPVPAVASACPVMRAVSSYFLNARSQQTDQPAAEQQRSAAQRRERRRRTEEEGSLSVQRLGARGVRLVSLLSSRTASLEGIFKSPANRKLLALAPSLVLLAHARRLCAVQILQASPSVRHSLLSLEPAMSLDSGPFSANAAAAAPLQYASWHELRVKADPLSWSE
jgi:hypothetical protein